MTKHGDLGHHFEPLLYHTLCLTWLKARPFPGLNFGHSCVTVRYPRRCSSCLWPVMHGYVFVLNGWLPLVPAKQGHALPRCLLSQRDNYRSVQNEPVTQAFSAKASPLFWKGRCWRVAFDGAHKAFSSVASASKLEGSSLLCALIQESLCACPAFFLDPYPQGWCSCLFHFVYILQLEKL